MFGAYRLALAILVAVVHIEILDLVNKPDYFGQYGHYGIIGFYLLSGYAVTGLLRKNFPTIKHIGSFYIDRVLRIFPHYLTIAAITLLLFIAGYLLMPEITGAPSFTDIVSNIFILPANYFEFIFGSSFMLVPLTWSLGAELQFYFALPLLLFFGKRMEALFLSLGIYLLAAFQILDPILFGYIFAPGLLFVFLIGSLLYDHKEKSVRVISIVAASCSLLFIILSLTQPTLPHYVKELPLAILVAAILVGILSHFRRHTFDEFLGYVSYGVFLNHPLVKWLFFNGTVTGWQVVPYLFISLFISALIYVVVERPVFTFRRIMRNELSGI